MAVTLGIGRSWTRSSAPEVENTPGDLGAGKLHPAGQHGSGSPAAPVPPAQCCRN